MDDLLAQSCLVYGPAVGAGVAVLKRMGFVGRFIARNPKLVAGVLSGLAIVATTGLSVIASGSLAGYAICVAATFAGAVTTHEVVLDPAAKALGMPDPKRPES